MDYEQKYKEALERAKKLYEKGTITESIGYIFSELAMSEDERVRKALIELVKCNERNGYTLLNNVSTNSMLAWLEKQGDKPQGKSALEAIKEVEVDNTNKIEPKFKVGNWIASNINNSSSLLRIIDVDDKDYEVETPQGDTGVSSIESIDNNFHLWTVQDAKPGDVLVDEDNNMGIFQECGGICWHSYIYLGCDGKLRGFSIGGSHKQTDTHPATKEQRDALERAIEDAGYAFDFERKELKITDISKHLMYNPNAPSIIEQEPTTWSEEDEKIMTNLIDYLNAYDALQYGYEEVTNWLKSIKERLK